MPISVKSCGVVVNAYNEACFLGFKRLPSNSLVGVFKVNALPLQVTKLYREPVELSMLNELREAAGLKPLRTISRLVLPAVGDRNMLGYNRRMKVFLILKDNGYYDIEEVRHINFKPEEESLDFDPDTGEVIVYEPGPLAA